MLSWSNLAASLSKSLDAESETLRPLLERVSTMGRDALRMLPQVSIACVALLVTWGLAALVSWFLERTLSRSAWRPSLRVLVRQLVYVAVWVAGLLVSANIAFPSMTPGKTLAALGLGSIAIGFAFKDIFENFFAGILLLWRFPFENGDFIQCGDVHGEVLNTTIRMTTVRRVDGELLVVPNSYLLKSPVDVLTDRPNRRLRITCGVAYGEDVDEARGVIQRAVEGCGGVEEGHGVEVFAQAFGSSSIDFEVAWWTDPTPLGQRRSRDEVVAAVKRALDEAGIEIPFPYRTLTFKEPLRVDRAGERSGSEPTHELDASRSEDGARS